MHIENALKILSPFRCFSCGEELIAKNRDFPERVKVFHFAHKGGGGCGTGESEHHYNVKCFFYDLLKTKLENFETYTAYIITGSALKKYDFDILEDIEQISIEKKTAGDFLPDLSLLSNGKLKRVIEIVYKHEDSPEKIAFYMQQKIEVCKIYINEDTYDKIKFGNIPRIRYFDQPHRVYKRETEKVFHVLYRYFGHLQDKGKRESSSYFIKPSKKYPNHKINIDRWVTDKKDITDLSGNPIVIQKETHSAYLINLDYDDSKVYWIPKSKCEIQKNEVC